MFDKGAAGAGASHAAAGMLAACAEAEPGEQALVALGRESQARWPAFAAELQQVSGIDVGLRSEGTLVVTADDQAPLLHQLAFQQKLGLPLRWISAAETRRREPHLAAPPRPDAETADHHARRSGYTKNSSLRRLSDH